MNMYIVVTATVVTIDLWLAIGVNQEIIHPVNELNPPVPYYISKFEASYEFVMLSIMFTI